MELRLLEKKDISQIAELEKHLWKEGYKEREKKLIWKYEKAPENKYLGAVAVENNKIIGFRGLVSSNWRGNGKTLKLVHFTDAVVSPDHRGKGVLSKLNKFLQTHYKDKFDLIMVFFPNEISGHIYRSQGVSSFFKVGFFYRKFLIKKKKPSKKFEVISNDNEIYLLLESYYNRIPQKIHLDYSEDYINWKLSEPDKKFVVLRSKNNPECFAIIDDAEKKVEVQFFCEDQVKESLKLIENYARLAKKSYINLPLSSQTDNSVIKVVLKRGFKTYSAINLFKQDFFAQKDVLIRTFNENNSDLSRTIKSPEKWDYQHFIYV